MTAKEFKEGDIILKAGDLFDSVMLLAKGSVKAAFPYGEISLKKGNVIGLLDFGCPVHSCSYTALSAVTLIAYEYETPEDLTELFCHNREITTVFAASATEQLCSCMDAYVLLRFSSDTLFQSVHDSYEEYEKLCKTYLQTPKSPQELLAIKPLVLKQEIEDWQVQYYEAMRRLDSSLLTSLFQDNPNITIGYLYHSAQTIQQIYAVCKEITLYQRALITFLLNQEAADLFALLTDLYTAVIQTASNAAPITGAIGELASQLAENPCTNKELYNRRIKEYIHLVAASSARAHKNTSSEESAARNVLAATADSLHTILQYADAPAKINDAFRTQIMAFRRVEDKNADAEEIQALRKKLTAGFYEIYSHAFRRSLTDKSVPTVVKMFLNFGYMDEVLAGSDNAAYLYSIAEETKGDASKGIYTLPEWLTAISEGKKEPSRNEFDVDYAAYVHEMKVAKTISAAEEQIWLKNHSEKILYELKNMFPIVNKVTFGRITTFCPILCEQNILKPLDSVLAKPEILTNALNTLRSIDYSAYYRENVYSNPDCSITREMIDVEILPNFILMPNIGTRAVMWQEIEGRKRTTPARMMVSVFSLTDIKALMIQLTATFRWEMCKRVQGARWNDMSDPSLTSEYCDYAQFYRKNNDLSAQSKEQIKSNLLKAKNNFRELFIRDYMVFIMYEAAASPRLNKVVRSILFKFCPFSRQIREKLTTNPLFIDLISRYDFKKKQRISHLDNVIRRLSLSGTAIPEEIACQQELLER